MAIFEKQCTVCGMIWEDTRPIQQNPFICPHCKRAIREQEQHRITRARKVLLRNKKKYA